LKLILRFMRLLFSRNYQMRLPRRFVEKNPDVNFRMEWWIVGGSSPNRICHVNTTHKHRDVENLQD
jgi:hypothetical protein